MIRPACAAVVAAFLVACLLACPVESPARQERGKPAFLSDAQIRRILAERVKALSTGREGIEIVAGVVGPKGRSTVSYGRPNTGDSRAPDGNTVFEVGSVGKSLTALLLAEMVRKGEVALDDSVSRYLPQLSIPSGRSRPITLVDLATHTSGLPFMPDQPAPAAGARPADSTRTHLHEFLAGYKLPYDPGSKWEYSNVGYWLLGEALAARAGVEFKILLRDRVILPLNLENTGFALSPEMIANIAVGHDAALQPSPAMSSLPVYSLMHAAGAGLFSTVNDLSKILSVAMGYEPSGLAEALTTSVTTRRPTAQNGKAQALGWTILGQGIDQLVVRDGGTLGYAACVVWDPGGRVGVVVLSNQVASVTDIALHVLRPDSPLEHPIATKHTEITLEAARLDSCVGSYEAAGEGVFTIARVNDHLMIESPAAWGLPALRLRPESATEFFVSELPLRVSFQLDGEGGVNGILIHPPRGQKAVPAHRIAKQ